MTDNPTTPTPSESDQKCPPGTPSFGSLIATIWYIALYYFGSLTLMIVVLSQVPMPGRAIASVGLLGQIGLIMQAFIHNKRSLEHALRHRQDTTIEERTHIKLAASLDSPITLDWALLTQTWIGWFLLAVGPINALIVAGWLLNWLDNVPIAGLCAVSFIGLHVSYLAAMIRVSRHRAILLDRTRNEGQVAARSQRETRAMMDAVDIPTEPDAVPRSVWPLLTAWNLHTYAVPPAMVIIVFGVPWQIGVPAGIALILRAALAVGGLVDTHQRVKQHFGPSTRPIGRLERRYTRYVVTLQEAASDDEDEPTLRAQVTQWPWWMLRVVTALFAVTAAAWMLRHAHSMLAASTAVVVVMTLDTLSVVSELYFHRNGTRFVTLFGRLARYHRARSDPEFAATVLKK